MDNVKIKAAILTISDTRQTGDDLSGDRLAGLLFNVDAEIVSRSIVSDDRSGIERALRLLSADPGINLILTTGGTGFGPRDNTPEATREVIEREAPGIAEAMRRETAAKTPLAILSRGVCGITDGTLIINLPGSPKAVEECFEVIRPILVHAVELIAGKTRHQ